MKKKILPILLALCAVLTIPSAGAFAADGGFAARAGYSGAVGGLSIYLRSGITGGTVTVQPAGAVHKGDLITVTLTPSAGYQVYGIRITDTYGNEIRANRVSYSSEYSQYTFSMPATDAAVLPDFIKIETEHVIPEDVPIILPELPSTQIVHFEDVPEDAYCYDAVMWAVENGITSGYGSDTLFAPDVTVTRGEVVTFLWRAAGSPEPSRTTCPFTDVEEDAFYYSAILWAVERSITNGAPGVAFSPDTAVNRAEAVTLLYRAAGSPPVDSEITFTDVAENAYYAVPVKWAVTNQITNGYGSPDLFAPGIILTRGEIMTFLYRALR